MLWFICPQVKVWSLASGFCFVTFTDHAAPVTGVAWLPSGNAVLSSSLVSNRCRHTGSAALRVDAIFICLWCMCAPVSLSQRAVANAKCPLSMDTAARKRAEAHHPVHIIQCTC